MQEPQIRQPSMSCKVDGPNKALYPFGHGLAYSQVGDSVGSLCGGLSKSEALRNLSERKRAREKKMETTIEGLGLRVWGLRFICLAERLRLQFF